MNTTPTKDINVHEYPEGADDRTLLAYRIAVMQAFLNGASIELRRRGHQEGFEALVGAGPTAAGTPLFDWSFYEYRVARPKPRYFRSKHRLFTGLDGRDPYCVEIIAPNTTTFVYADGRRVPGEEGNTWSISAAEQSVADGHWVEFDGNMAPFVTKPEPAPQEKLSAKILRLLGELPEKYRVQARSAFYAAPLTLCDYEGLADRIQTPADAVLYGFFWNRTSEGWSFWYSVETEVRCKQGGAS